MHEDALARLREHPALLGCLILHRSSPPSSPPSSVGGHQDLAGGHEEGTVTITESDRILRTLRCGVSCRLGALGNVSVTAVECTQIIRFCVCGAEPLTFSGGCVQLRWHSVWRTGCAAEYARIRDQGGAFAAPLARRQRRAQPFPRPARRTPGHTRRTRRPRRPARHVGWCGIAVFLAACRPAPGHHV